MNLKQEAGINGRPSEQGLGLLQALGKLGILVIAGAVRVLVAFVMHCLDSMYRVVYWEVTEKCL